MTDQHKPDQPVRVERRWPGVNRYHYPDGGWTDVSISNEQGGPMDIMSFGGKTPDWMTRQGAAPQA